MFFLLHKRLPVLRTSRGGLQADVPDQTPLPVLSNPCQYRNAVLGLGRRPGARLQSQQRGKSDQPELSKYAFIFVIF